MAQQSLTRNNTDALLALIREGKPMTMRQQLWLTLQLSVPSMLAQFSSIAMQYIDASMVGSLGANPAASIGLMSTTTWLFGGLCSAAATGFSVQVAHAIGAGDIKHARNVLRQSIASVLMFGCMMAAIGMTISGYLPEWLGGDPAIRSDATTYFFIYSLFLPVLQMNFLASGMLRCSGNMRIPSILNVLMCLLDVIFNYFLIFDTRQVAIGNTVLLVPGAGLGVEGAILGTVLAESVTASLMTWYLCRRSPMLNLTTDSGRFIPQRSTLKKAVHIGLPMGIEHAVICGAQIMSTVIVAPLGIFAIAANSFAFIPFNSSSV